MPLLRRGTPSCRGQPIYSEIHNPLGSVPLAIDVNLQLASFTYAFSSVRRPVLMRNFLLGPLVVPPQVSYPLRSASPILCVPHSLGRPSLLRLFRVRFRPLSPCDWRLSFLDWLFYLRQILPAFLFWHLVSQSVSSYLSKTLSALTEAEGFSRRRALPQS